VRTASIWIRNLALAISGYLLFTIVGSIVITAAYYWLLLIKENESWGQISLTGAAVVAGSVVARYVYVHNRPHLSLDKNRRTATHAGILCGWEALAALFLFTSNFTKLMGQYDDINDVADVTLWFLLVAYLAVCVASVMAIRITARFFIRPNHD